MGASSELHVAITNMPAPNLIQAKLFKPNGSEEWNQFSDGANTFIEKEIEKMLKQFSVQVRTDKIDGVNVRYIEPKEIAPEHANHLFIHLHEGGYIFGRGSAGITEAILIAARSKINVVSIDYPMPPDNPFPAAIDDVVIVYRNLISQYSPQKIAIGGTSAGGGLALASIHKFKELDLSLPGAVYTGSPWADLTKTGDSHYVNEGIDRVAVTYDGWLKAAAELYADGQDLKHPFISPIYGDFENFPPTYLVTGTRDLLLSDVVRTHRKLKLNGVEAELNVYEGLSHADYLYLINTPESVQIYEELGDFLIQYLR